MDSEKYIEIDKKTLIIAIAYLIGLINGLGIGFYLL